MDLVIVLITKQFGKAIKALKEGENIDNTELAIKLNLAHAYLLNGDYRAAKSIYKEYQNQNITASLSGYKIKDDFVVLKS
jgi:thioredoxin-like negative regulator of GroEL